MSALPALKTSWQHQHDFQFMLKSLLEALRNSLETGLRLWRTFAHIHASHQNEKYLTRFE